MKKALILIMAVALLSSGCAGFLKFSQQAQEKLCNPPEAVMTVIKGAAEVVKSILAIAVPGSQLYVSAVEAGQVVDAIQGGACVTVTQLNNLIAFLQSDAAQKAMAGQKVFVNVQPLQDWASKGK